MTFYLFILLLLPRQLNETSFIDAIRGEKRNYCQYSTTVVATGDNDTGRVSAMDQLIE